ncbi:MAG: acylneuraminate cytidylyltransferase family protein, partial [Sphingobacteriales bacterium]
MNILVTICARGGSKGIPGKNIKQLNGKPLIHYTIETAEKFRELGYTVDIVLSTESSEIKKIVEAGNFSVDTSYTRPEEQATDTAGKLDVITGAMRYSEQENNKKYDFVIDMDVTSPLRNASDVQNALKLLQADTDANNIFSVSPANRNPYFNMVEAGEDGYYK